MRGAEHLAGQGRSDERQAETATKKEIMVDRYVPELASAETNWGGTKKNILHVFGLWRSMDELRVEAIAGCFSWTLVRSPAFQKPHDALGGDGRWR